MLAIINGDMSIKDAAGPVYGVPVRNMQRYLFHLADLLLLPGHGSSLERLVAFAGHSAANATTLEHTINTMDFKMGRPALINTQESLLCGQYWTALNESGHLATVPRMRQTLKDVCENKRDELAAKAQQLQAEAHTALLESDVVRSEQLMKASVKLKKDSMKFRMAKIHKSVNLRVRKEAAVASGQDPTKSKLQKSRRISQQRAKGMSPIKEFEARKKYANLFSSLFAEGILRTEFPSAEQVYNLDEVGQDPNGSSWSKYFTLGNPVHRQKSFKDKLPNFSVVTGEHAPFWCTLIFTTRADGIVPLEPMVIHEVLN